MSEPTPSQAPPAPAIESRVSALEEKLKAIDAFQDKHLRAITTIFGIMGGIFALVSLIIAGLAVYGKIELGDARKDMEHRFEVLAGQALRQPVFRILVEGKSLDNSILEVLVVSSAPVYPYASALIEVKNTGDRPNNGPISMRLYAAESLGWSTPFLEEHNTDDDVDRHTYPFKYSWAGNATVSPREVFSLIQLSGNYSEPQPSAPPKTKPIPHNVKCKLRIFYGAEQPAEADFVPTFQAQSKP